MEIDSTFNIITPSIYVPPCQLKLTKLFSYSNNYVEINLNMPERLQRDVSIFITTNLFTYITAKFFFQIYLKTSWLIKSRNEFRSMVLLETPFIGLENTTAAINVHLSNGKSTMSMAVQMHPLDIEMQSTLQNNIFTSTSVLNFNNKR